MFTSSIISKTFSEGVMQVLVEFTNGTETLRKAFNITSELDLKSQVRNEASRLTALSAFFKTLANGAYDPTDADPTPPTQAETDKQVWFREFGRLERAQRLIDLQVLTGLEGPVVTLYNKVKTNFKPAYIADM